MAKDGLEVLILQFLPYAPYLALIQGAVITGKHVSSCQIYVVPGMEPTTSGKLGSHFAS